MLAPVVTSVSGDEPATLSYALSVKTFPAHVESIPETPIVPSENVPVPTALINVADGARVIPAVTSHDAVTLTP